MHNSRNNSIMLAWLFEVNFIRWLCYHEPLRAQYSIWSTTRKKVKGLKFCSSAHNFLSLSFPLQGTKIFVVLTCLDAHEKKNSVEKQRKLPQWRKTSTSSWLNCSVVACNRWKLCFSPCVRICICVTPTFGKRMQMHIKLKKIKIIT